jgi:hypothetical protein
MDKRKALGDGSGQRQDSDDMMYFGLGTYGHSETRPIADMKAQVGSGCIKKGVAFCEPMDQSRHYDRD